MIKGIEKESFHYEAKSLKSVDFQVTVASFILKRP